MTFVFVCFTSLSVIISRCCKRHYFILFYGWVVFYCLKWSEAKVTQSLNPWNSPGQNTRVGSLFLFQGIFPTQGSNPGLPHCRWILYQLSQRGRPSLKTALKQRVGPESLCLYYPPTGPPHQHQHNSWMQWCTEGWARGEICPGCRQ